MRPIILFLTSILLLHGAPAHAVKKDRYDLKNAQGKVIDTLKADRIIKCSDGLYLACDGKVKKKKEYKFVDAYTTYSRDRKVVECRKSRFYFASPEGFVPLHDGFFESATCFREGVNLIEVRKNGKWGLVRKQDGIRNGDYFFEIGTAVPFVYDAIGSQCSPYGRYDQCLPTGIFPFRSGDRWGYMDSRGQVLIEPQYLEAGSFSGGEFSSAWVKVNDTGNEHADRQRINLLGDLLRPGDNTRCGRTEPNLRFTASPAASTAGELNVRPELFPLGEPDGFDCRKWETESWFSGAEIPAETKVTPQLSWLTYRRPGESLYLWDIPFDSVEYEFSRRYNRPLFAAGYASTRGTANWDRLTDALFRLYGRVGHWSSDDKVEAFRWVGKTTLIRAVRDRSDDTVKLLVESVAVRDWEDQHILRAAKEGTLLMPDPQ